MVPLLGQEPVARRVKGHRGEPTTIILFSRHNFKQSHNDIIVVPMDQRISQPSCETLPFSVNGD